MKHAREDYNRIQDPEGKIPEDEPVFLLRGQDKHAASAVRYWARLVRADGGDAELAAMAIAQADCMTAWGISKQPDL